MYNRVVKVRVIYLSSAAWGLSCCAPLSPPPLSSHDWETNFYEVFCESHSRLCRARLLSTTTSTTTKNWIEPRAARETAPFRRGERKAKGEIKVLSSGFNKRARLHAVSQSVSAACTLHARLDVPRYIVVYCGVVKKNNSKLLHRAHFLCQKSAMYYLRTLFCTIVF